MTSSISSPSPFEIHHIKNAKLVKLEIKPFYITLCTIILNHFHFIKDHWDPYLFYIRHRSTTASTVYPSFQITFPQQETSSIRTYRRTINPINLLIPIQEVFHAFLNKVKDFNLALENPKYSPNSLEELEQYIHNFEVEDIERLVIAQNNSHHLLQTDVIKIQNFL